MSQIVLADYWMGRDKKYPPGLLIESKAQDLLRRVNALIAKVPSDVVGDIVVTSGYRPPAINRTTPGAALKSLHMTGQAIDLLDADGLLDDWCMDNLKQLELGGLWLEHPAATKGWCHLQSQPPRSGKRVFYP